MSQFGVESRVQARVCRDDKHTVSAGDQCVVEILQDLFIAFQVFEDVRAEDGIECFILPERESIRIRQVSLNGAYVSSLAEAFFQTRHVSRVAIEEHKSFPIDQQ